MEITAENLAGINKSFQVKFNTARAAIMAFYKLFCMECPSTAGENVYGWLADLPQVSKVTSEYIRKRLQTLGYRLTNEKFGGILEVKRESIEDDQYGMFGTVASQWGTRAAQTPDLELLQLFVNAFSPTKGKDYTGSAFFGTVKKAHSKALAFTNKDTKKLSVANFQAAVASLVERQDAEGVPLFLGQNRQQLFLVVTSDDQSLAESIVEMQFLTGGGNNPNYQKAKLVVLPGLKSAAQSSAVINDSDALPWYLLDCSMPVKPMIYQLRTAFELTPSFQLTADRVFNEDVFQWKTRGRMALGFGLPEYAFGSTGEDPAA